MTSRGQREVRLFLKRQRSCRIIHCHESGLSSLTMPWAHETVYFNAGAANQYRLPVSVSGVLLYLSDIDFKKDKNSGSAFAASNE